MTQKHKAAKKTRIISRKSNQSQSSTDKEVSDKIQTDSNGKMDANVIQKPKRKSSIKDKVDNLNSCIEAIVSNITAKTESTESVKEEIVQENQIADENFIKLEDRVIPQSSSDSDRETISEEGEVKGKTIKKRKKRLKDDDEENEEFEDKSAKPKTAKKPVKKKNEINKLDNESETNESVYCEICDENFKDSLEFVLHSIKHSDNEKYMCHICEFQTPLKYSVISHVKSHKQKPSHKCEMCNKRFNIRSYAEEHKYFHTGEKPFQCEVCGKDFMFSRFLSWHRRTHHWENITGSPLVKYDCLICNKHYLTSKGLALHKQKYHMEGFDQSKLCDICGKRLANIVLILLLNVEKRSLNYNYCILEIIWHVKYYSNKG